MTYTGDHLIQFFLGDAHHISTTAQIVIIAARHVSAGHPSHHHQEQLRAMLVATVYRPSPASPSTPTYKPSYQIQQIQRSHKCHRCIMQAPSITRGIVLHHHHQRRPLTPSIFRPRVKLPTNPGAYPGQCRRWPTTTVRPLLGIVPSDAHHLPASFPAKRESWSGQKAVPISHRSTNRGVLRSPYVTRGILSSFSLDQQRRSCHAGRRPAP